MKKFILLALISTIIALIFLIYTKVIISDSTLGPSSVLFISFIAILALFSFFSLIGYETEKREIITNIWLLIISTMLIYLVIDLAFGYFFIPRLSPPMLRDKYVHHKLAPNTNSKHRSREFNYIQRVNKLGLRGSDIQLTKKPGTYRILMLGDSFTMGKGVGDNETFSARLQKSLNRNSTAINSSIFEILNAGVDSYAPILSFLQLKMISEPLDPDLVVLNFDMSDLVQELAYRNAATYGSNGEILGISAFSQDQNPGLHDYAATEIKDFTTAVRSWIDKNLYFSRLVLFFLENRTTSSSKVNIRNTVSLACPELLKHTLSEDKADRTEQWQNVFDSILNIKKYCDSHGMNFLLVIYPWGHQVNESEWIPGRRMLVPDGALVSDKSILIIEDFAATNSIELLNVFTAFRSYNGEHPLYFSHDMHWTPTGHELMARELYRFILNRFVRMD